MTTLTGNNIEYDFSDLVKVADLIHYEGSLLSHYRSPRNEDFLFYWVDADKDFNRWLVTKVNTLLLQDYQNKEITLRELISNPSDGFVYFVDIDDDVIYHNIKLVTSNKIPEEYLPYDTLCS